MKKSTFLKLVLATLLVVLTYIGAMEMQRNKTMSDEELAMAYMTERFGEGDYVIDLDETDGDYVTFSSYEDGCLVCNCVSLNREYFTEIYAKR